MPYFFEKGNGFEWSEDDKFGKDGKLSKDDNLNLIINSITSSFEDAGTTWSKIIALSGFFLAEYKDRKKAIDTIFDVVTKVSKKARADADLEAFLMQAATAARYDIEIYRGTFIPPTQILNFIAQNYRGSKLILDGFIDESSSGLIVEGACANGECLRALTNRRTYTNHEVKFNFKMDFALGLDISGSMIRNAQKNVPPEIRDYMLFVQGDISSLPLKANSVGLYILNNVFDRVIDPLKACEQANLILRQKGIFVLSNCDPLQFGYTTDSGEEIIFVPKDKQVSLKGGLTRAGFNILLEEQGVWNIETVAYGSEELPYKSLIGTKSKIGYKLL